MRRRSNPTALVLACCVFGMAFTGCATPVGSTPPAGGTPALTTETAAPDAVPAADPVEEVSTLVVRPDGIELNDTSGATVLAVSYEDPAETMIAALTVAIGAAPEVREDGGGLESPPSVRYEWPGLTVLDPEPVDGLFPGLTNLQVSVSAPSIGEIASVETVQGYQVGTETAPILAEHGWTVQEFGAFHFPAEFGTELGAASGDNRTTPTPGPSR